MKNRQGGTTSDYHGIEGQTKTYRVCCNKLSFMCGPIPQYFITVPFLASLCRRFSSPRTKPIARRATSLSCSYVSICTASSAVNQQLRNEDSDGMHVPGWNSPVTSDMNQCMSLTFPGEILRIVMAKGSTQLWTGVPVGLS